MEPDEKSNIMKKFIGSLIASFLAITAGAATPAPTLTNVITRVNVQLTFASAVSTNTSYATNIVIHRTAAATNYATNYVTNIVYKSINKAIATKDVIGALLPGAPKNAYLAQVRTVIDGFVSGYFAIRQGSTTLAVINPANTGNGISLFPLLPNDVAFGSERDTTGKSAFAANTKSTSLVNLIFNSFSTLDFNVYGVVQQKWTGDSVSIEGTSFAVTDATITVIGSGTDAIGANEIVTGTIILNGAQLSD